MSVNIKRDVKDPFYRYKMPKLIAKVEGKGNGIKTVICNMSAVSQSLRRPATYTTKYFGCELGAQVICDDKALRYVVNGAHDVDKLQTLLDGFIQRFVLCSSCNNPETDLIIGKDGNIVRTCKACGKITSVSMTHKLIPYIIKNPPSASYAEKYEKAQESSSFPESQATESLKSQIESPSVLVDMMNNGHLEFQDKDGSEENPIDAFGNAMTANPQMENEEIYKKVEEFGVKEDLVVAILAQTIFSVNMLKELSDPRLMRVELFKKFTQKNDKNQLALIGGIERLVSTAENKPLFDAIPQIFLYLYEADLVEEEIFIKWYERLSKKYVDKETAKLIRQKAEKFIVWLKEAETEE